MARGGKKQDPEAKENKILGEEYVNKLNSAGPDELKQMMTEATSQTIQQKDLRKRDPDLIRLKDQFSVAGASYREALKRLDICTRRIKKHMESKGMDTGTFEEPQSTKQTDEQVERLGGPKPESPNSEEVRRKTVDDLINPGGSLVIGSLDDPRDLN